MVFDEFCSQLPLIDEEKASEGITVKSELSQRRDR